MARRFVVAILVVLFAAAAFAAVDDSRASFFTAYLTPAGTFPQEIGKLGAYFFTVDRNTGAVSYELRVGSVENPARVYVVKNGTSPTTLFDLINDPAAFDSEGRAHGSRSVNTSLFADLIAHPSDYAIYVADTQGRVAARTTLASAFEYEVPIAGHVNGSHGELFVTDLRMFAPAQKDFADRVYAMVEYFPSTTTENPAAASTFITGSAGRGTMSFDDVVASQLHMPGTTGAIRVTSGKPLTVATRTYDDQRASGRGTLGQFVAAQDRSQALIRGALTALSESAVPTTGYRTNIGFFNANESSATVSLELRDETGNVIGTSSVTLAAKAQRQLSLPALFPNAHAIEDNVSVAFTATQNVFVYASVVDNRSSDPYYVEAKADAPPPAQ